MIELALSLAGHTHPRPLSEAFLHILQDRSAARTVELHRTHGGDGGEIDELYAVLNAPVRGDVVVEEERRLAVPDVGYVVLRGVGCDFSPPELAHTLAVFGRSFRACTANEREHRALRERELAVQQMLQARTALVGDVRAKLLAVLDRLPPCEAGGGADADTLQALRQLVQALPLDPAAAPERRRPAPTHRAPQARRVLVVEDFAPLRMMFRMQLEALDYEVDEATDGAEALRRWIAERHDLVLTDLNMPGMDGIALTRALRFHEGDVDQRLPVIGITGSSDDETLALCREAGMSDVLTKPIDIAVLERTLGRFTAGSAEPGTAPPASDIDESAPVLDLSSLRRALGGLSHADVLAVVQTFLDAAAEGLQRLQVQPTAAALRDEMHRQKSGARSIGALRYARLAEGFEHALGHGESVDLPAALAALQAALAELVTHSRERRAELVDSGALVASAAPQAPAEGIGCVLVVDDDPVIRLQLRNQLASLGVGSVLEAANGMQAREQLRRRSAIDLVFCDLNMPEMDGVELLRDLGRDRYAGAIALLSGEDSAVMATAGNLAALHGLRVVARLRKPVDRGALQAALQALGTLISVPASPRAAGEITPEALLRGMARGEFSVQLQPQVDTTSLRAVGVEALARWTTATGVQVPPDRFIVAAEQCGLIHPLSELLVREAFAAGAALHRAGHALRISVNLSAVWLDRLDLPDQLGALCTQYGLRPDDVVLEVTETGVARDLASALDILTRLRLRGFGLSIDDFGVGYSSFEQLRRVPFTELKLDRSFVSQSGTDEAARVILESTMRIASRLRLVTVAEGVETEADLALVRRLGCPTAQGYLFARPMDVAATLDWLAQRDSAAPAA